MIIKYVVCLVFSGSCVLYFQQRRGAATLSWDVDTLWRQARFICERSRMRSGRRAQPRDSSAALLFKPSKGSSVNPAVWSATMYLAGTRLSLWTSVGDMGKENGRRGAVLQPDHSNSFCFRDPGVPVRNGCRCAMKFSMQILPTSEIMWFSIKSETSSTYWVAEESLIMDGQQVCVVTNSSISFDSMDLIDIYRGSQKSHSYYSVKMAFSQLDFFPRGQKSKYFAEVWWNLKHSGQ